MTPILELQDLSFRYEGGLPGEKVLDALTFAVAPGERVGLVGCNGVGKSTLLKILRQFTVHDGKVELHGICKGAGLGPAGNLRRNGTVEYYLSEDVVHDEQKGVGVCMMAYAEYLQAKQAGALTDDFPKVEIFNKGYDPIMPGDPAFIAFEKNRVGKTG